MTSSTYFATRQRQPSASTRAFYRKLKLENNLHFLISGETPPCATTPPNTLHAAEPVQPVFAALHTFQCAASSSAAASQNRSDSICQRRSWRTSADRLEEGAAENVCVIVWCDVTNFFFFSFIIRKRSVAGVLFCHSVCVSVRRCHFPTVFLDQSRPGRVGACFFFFLSVCCHSSPCHHGNN